ncbi:UDP-glucuronosyltransferase [Ornithinibacillus sp. L9]|uniref:UDP-glucuronosyltransferase n=1 Tax=Ornithinibacillus caprae TaxID=2678566 RepID=A0A6N8FIM4_9BACI|nr:glycosyltransferase [Ornithinibacillus caprae]MUK89091.1 UDP-glucuronosyltransferase [Ornithinibacillus caprae]
MEPSTTKKEALFLPFMQIPTGHHHVADAIMEDLKNYTGSIRCNKVDILSYSYGKIESVVSGTYLRWIQSLPSAYHWLYDRMAYKQAFKRNRQYVYEVLFMYFFKRLMKENEPNILFCTHALPSNIASVLKQKGNLHGVIVNVYTDYFVNKVWGMEGVDYHFVPSIEVKNFLLRLGVNEEQIYVTGIPVHPVFHQPNKLQRKKDTGMLKVLVTGGSLGVGGIEQLLEQASEKHDIHYYVLCGKNEILYRKLKSLRNDITPISYIENKEEINHLYDMVDAVITKPGGVTVSECLMKRKPIFICNALPGQEKINEVKLKELGVVIPIQRGNIEQQILNFFSGEKQFEEYMKKIDSYHHYLEEKSMDEILAEICSFD